MKSIPTARIILDTRRKKQSGLYPVKLRVTFERKHRYYPTGKDISEIDFERTYGAKPREEFKILRKYFAAIETAAKAAINSTLPFFSFEKFEAEYYKDALKKSSDDLAEAYRAVIESLQNEGRIGNADSFKCSRDSLWKFKDGLTFADITPDFLHAYERWMLAQGRSITTVGIYLRALRSLVIDAIQKGTVKNEAYPFGSKKPLYKIPAGQNIKKALSRAELQKIFEYKPETPSEVRARDFWIFSYLCNGINPKDIAELKYKNLDRATQKITFRRAKTKRTNRDSKPAEIYLQPAAVEILERYATKPENPEAYIFPILTNGDSAQRQDDDISNFVKLINKPMKAIAEKLGIEKPVTTYVARHSFATMLKRSGAPTEFISESLRHQDLKTTEKYLDSFEDTTKRKFGKALLDFTGEDE
ncbi:MAG TPA: site-specific integrase [Smithellaceae bacterium]|nr:site-specific integrase [Smithellaceae bacterium]